MAAFKLLDRYIIPIALMILLVYPSMALYWYLDSQSPIMQIIEDPKVIYANPNEIAVEWNLYRKSWCPGKFHITALSKKSSLVESLGEYPYILFQGKMRFIRVYKLPNLAAGQLDLQFNMETYCNPLFPNQQVIVIPFEIKDE